MTLKYLITGVTGGLGEKVLDYFVAHVPAGEFAAASSRESNRQQFEDRGIAFRQVNYEDTATLDAAFRDVENLLFVSTNVFDNERRRKQHQNFVDAAKRNGVKHVWYTSLAFGGFTDDSKAAVQTVHLETEAMLRESGVTYTSVREGGYTEAFPVFLNWYPDSTSIKLPTDGPIAFTLRTELGEATARLMIAGGHENEIVLLTAEETIRPSEVADLINETTGRQVEFQRVSPEDFVSIAGEKDQGGKPKAFFEMTLTWYEGIEKGELATTHPLMRELLGREPTKPREAIARLLRENRDYTWHQNYVKKWIQGKWLAGGLKCRVDATRRIIENGAIHVENDLIADIGKTDALRAKHPDDEEYDLTGRIIIPGLISTHMHTAQTLLRGTADDLELVSWLCERIWVLQGHFTAEDGYAAARLSIGEMLKSGTTCFLESMFADRYGFDGLARAVEESGIRGCLGKIVMDIARYAQDDAWAMHPGLVEDRETSLLGTEKGIPITMHCAEVRTDRDFFASVRHTPMSYCNSVGLLSPSTVLVHMVHLDDDDIAHLASSGTHVAHCPTSNAKLASGICRVPDLQRAGVNIGLGTDGAPCNNTCDLLQEMKLAGIIHKSLSHDPTAVPAESVLEMATINGARALGLDNRIGSLKIGKKADFVAIDTRRIHLQPWFNPVSAVVYTATGRDVDVVVVDGKVLVRGGELVTMDEEEIVREAQRRSQEVVARAGLKDRVRARWPVE
ncbi:hypothetical protein BBP40_006151 [Aspergillus hancockii]|nr:hypothetical protein BBP40_006151 [Aspergillus hancockii]